MPEWLRAPQAYEPLSDRSSFVTRSMLSLASVLSQLRLDDGRDSPLSPTAPVKMALALATIVMNSLARNLMVTLVLLAFVLTRAALLPRRALARVAGTSLVAAGVTLLVMLPAALLGQPSSALRLGTKALVSTGLVMEVALTTPAGQLTSGLRAFRVPNLVIMTFDLAMRSIVSLGGCAMETLTALGLRSVGRDDDKRSSMGGVGGALLVRAGVVAQGTNDAMRCRGFEGEYDGGARVAPRLADAAWIAAFALFVVLFLNLEGIV